MAVRKPRLHRRAKHVAVPLVVLLVLVLLIWWVLFSPATASLTV